VLKVVVLNGLRNTLERILAFGDDIAVALSTAQLAYDIVIFGGLRSAILV